MKALVGAFNQEKTLVGAFSVIVKTGCGTDGALYSTTQGQQGAAGGQQHRYDALLLSTNHLHFRNFSHQTL